MKSAVHKLLSVAMALLLLASTTSWRVEKHYCMGHLVDIALFSEAKSCGMDMEADMEETNEIVKQSKSCCSEEVIAIAGQDKVKLSFNDIHLDQQLFIVALTGYYFHLFEGPSQDTTSTTHYPPPLIVKDIHVLDQVYLI